MRQTIKAAGIQLWKEIIGGFFKKHDFTRQENVNTLNCKSIFAFNMEWN